MKELRTYKASDNLEKYGKYLPSDIKMNEGFYQYVMSDVDKQKTGIYLSVDIYQSLNEKVSYNEIFVAFGQDTSLKFIKDIYNQNIQDITIDKNAIVCTSWSLLFAYMLQQNGYDVVIGKNTTHHYVYFKADDYILRADATEKLEDKKDGSRLSDITRCKLGICPEGLLIYEKNIDGRIDENGVNLFESNIYNSNYYHEEKPHLENYTETIMKQLKDDTDFYTYPVPSEYKNVFSQFSVMSELISMNDLDVISSINYLNHLTKILIPEEERSKITKDYLKIMDNDELSFGLLLTYSPQKIENPRYCYFHPSVSGYNFLYTKKDGFVPISEEEAYNLQEKNDEVEMNITDDGYKRGGK